jgi:hypothetical protein
MGFLKPRYIIAAITAGFAIALSFLVGVPARGAAVGQSTAPGPVIKLLAAQDSLTVLRFGTTVYLDPGIWVASLGSALRLNVQRTSYTHPVTITQIMRALPGTTGSRPLPTAILGSWKGLRHFIRLTVKNQSGQMVVSSLLTFCPDSDDPERAIPDSAVASPYPQTCFPSEPFPVGAVWGIARGWAVDPVETSGGLYYPLRLGSYQVTETIMPVYLRLFHIAANNGTATVTVNVVPASQSSSCCSRHAPLRGTTDRQAGLPSPPPQVPYLARPPQAALPDLVSLPSWGIRTSNASGHDLLNFGATVWTGGNSPLDVEGFRADGSPMMQAYQYFWREGHLIGRIRAGTMGFDSQKGHNHWHFEQFAAYRLLNASKNLIVRSQKVGFCIAPTDPVDLTLPHAVWQPSYIGFSAQCGAPTALWVREYLPIGWGDTYFQSVAGQSFDITSLPNGTYYIEIIANPEHVLHELSYANDISLRKVILGGRPGHRTVVVPAWNGIDPES